MPEQAKVVDPRAEKSYRGKSYIAKGDSNPVKRQLVLQENKKTLLGINPWRFQY